MTLNESIDICSRGRPTPVWKEVENVIKDSVTDDNNTVVVEPITHREMKLRTRPQADVENPKTAYDMAVKIRQERRRKQSTDGNQQTVGMYTNADIIYVREIDVCGNLLYASNAHTSVWTRINSVK